jgi:hypothetical protein
MFKEMNVDQVMRPFLIIPHDNFTPVKSEINNFALLKVKLNNKSTWHIHRLTLPSERKRFEIKRAKYSYTSVACEICNTSIFIYFDENNIVNVV